jgi:hypothetical protein
MISVPGCLSANSSSLNGLVLEVQVSLILQSKKPTIWRLSKNTLLYYGQFNLCQSPSALLSSNSTVVLNSLEKEVSLVAPNISTKLVLVLPVTSLVRVMMKASSEEALFKGAVAGRRQGILFSGSMFMNVESRRIKKLLLHGMD